MRRRRPLAALVAAGALPLALAATLGTPSASGAGFGYSQLTPLQKRLVSGLASAELDVTGAAAHARTAAPLHATVPQRPGPNGCRVSLGANRKVNVNCLNPSDTDLQGRGQAQNEPWIAADPNNPQHVVASYNDYRRGDGTCGVSYSLDGGSTWADATTPNGFTRGTFLGKPRQYWQASGDTAVAWDTKGNAYLQCQMFNRGSAVSANPDQSSAIYVFRSTGTNGASWNFPGREVVTHDDTAGAGNVLLDKPFLAVDNHKGSRFADRVYVTWTTFAADGTSYIYGSYSDDYGESFSAPVVVSSASPVCTSTFGLPTPSGPCNVNQYSQPFVGRDGTLYVVWSNFNNTPKGKDNRNQVLLARSTDGGRTFGAPIKVTDYYDLPDCATYQGGQDPGRACVPEKGPSTNSVFRATNYPIGAADPTDPHRVVVTVGSYINRNSNERNGCTPDGFAADANNLFRGVKTGSCNNDVLLAVSNNGAHSFAAASLDPRVTPVVTDATSMRRTDQFWQAAGFTPSGSLVVSYYDRSYGDDETTGFSDVSVSTSSDRVSFGHVRATSSSMPPPTQFSGTFYGDYAGVTVAGSGTALPVWSDTRTVDEFVCPGVGPGNPPGICAGSAPNADVANDQETFTTRVHLGS